MRGIERVPPASATWIDATTLNATERTFWALPAPMATSELSLSDAATQLDGLLEDAVRLRLRSDVPVGLTLSGGVDSSSIAAAVSRLGAARAVRTFSVRWPSAEADEGPLIGRARASAGLDGVDVLARPEDLSAAMERLVWHQDEPFAHTAAFGQWMAYRLAAANGVHVVLEGQGADELFGGYQAASFGGRFASLAARGRWPTLVDELRAYRAVQRQSVGRAAAYAIAAAAPIRARAALRTLRWRSIGLGRPRALPIPFHRPSGGGGALTIGLRDATLTSSLPALLRYADRSSMAHSDEVRLPFLDPRIISFASALDESLLVSAGWTKRVVRESLRRHMPEVADVGGKRGFTAPEDEWIRGPLRPWIGDLVQRADQRGLFPRSAAAKVWESTRGGRVPAQVVWRVAVAELWLQRYVDAGGRLP
jgi:asparagine synthase (glutamine-hydrolysing)